MKIILDTNFLISAVRFKVDVFDQLAGHELFVLNKVLDELNVLSKGGGLAARTAQSVLKLISAKSLKVLHTNLSTDDALVVYAQQGYAIATQDKELKARIKGVGRIVCLKQRKRIEIL